MGRMDPLPMRKSEINRDEAPGNWSAALTIQQFRMACQSGGGQAGSDKRGDATGAAREPEGSAAGDPGITSLTLDLGSSWKSLVVVSKPLPLILLDLIRRA